MLVLIGALAEAAPLIHDGDPSAAVAVVTRTGVDAATLDPRSLASLRAGPPALAAGGRTASWAMAADPDGALERAEGALEGASAGGAIGAVDFDGDGVSSALIGTGGGDGFDAQSVYLLESDVTGAVFGAAAGLVIDARISGQSTAPHSCGAATSKAADLDGDGAADLMIGFSGDDRLAIVNAGAIDSAIYD